MGKRQFVSPRNSPGEQQYGAENDLESGANGFNHSSKRRPRFRDAVEVALDNKDRIELKKKLHKGVDNLDFNKYRLGKETIKQIKNKKVRHFYEKQNATIDNWIEVDTLVRTMADDILDSMDPDHDGDGIAERAGALQGVHEHLIDLLPEETREQRQKANRNARWAININVIANILLLLAKGIAALRSSSLSLLASLVDSALDLLCTLIVWSTNRLSRWRIGSLSKRFPVGRRRLEPLGILVFSVIMVISFLQILKESIEKILPGASHGPTTLPMIAIGSMAGTVGLKGLIWIGCARIKTTQVQVSSSSNIAILQC